MASVLAEDNALDVHVHKEVAEKLVVSSDIRLILQTFLCDPAEIGEDSEDVAVPFCSFFELSSDMPSQCFFNNE